MALESVSKVGVQLVTASSVIIDFIHRLVGRDTTAATSRQILPIIINIVI